MAEISIVIPTLNEELGIAPFLEQLQLLKPECELIVVDGGSSDATVSIAKPYVDCIVPSKKGRAVQMNLGAKKATAPLLLFLHADTFLPKDAIEQLRLARERNFSWGHFDITLTGPSKLFAIVSWCMNKRSRWTGIATGDQALFVDKSVFDKLGGFAEISLMEDIELSARLCKQAKAYCSKSKVISSGRRWISFGIMKTILLMWSLRLRYFFGADPDELEQLYRKGRFWKV